MLYNLRHAFKEFLVINYHSCSIQHPSIDISRIGIFGLKIFVRFDKLCAQINELRRDAPKNIAYVPLHGRDEYEGQNSIIFHHGDLNPCSKLVITSPYLRKAIIFTANVNRSQVH